MTRTDCTMRIQVKNSQIFRTIIPLIAVDMVNMFPWCKRSTKLLFHDKTMFQNPFAVDSNTPISSHIIESLGFTVTLLGTVFFYSDSTWRQVKRLCTAMADALYISKVMRSFTPQRSQSRYLDTGELSLSQTTPGTELCNLCPIRQNTKLFTTENTREINHVSIIS